MPKISAVAAARLAKIGEAMATQDNYHTAAPIWVVGTKTDQFPKVFLTEISAMEYAIDKYGEVSGPKCIKVASAQECDDIIVCMRACLEAAGFDSRNKKVNNAYFNCWY